MGYQEYVYKIDNIKNFSKKRSKIDTFIDKECSECVDYSLVEFKDDFKNIKKGIYVYACGDRYIGIKFLVFLTNEITGGTSYISGIESALDSYYGDNEYDEKLKDLFKEKSTPFARVIYSKEPEQGKQLDRSLF